MDLDDIYRLALALGLGLLVGFEREWAATRLAGIRTFPLVTLLGTLAALLAGAYGGWVLAGAFVALGGIVWSASARTPPGEHGEGAGITTEAALLVMFAVGAVVAQGPPVAGVAVAGATAVLLHWKRPLHDFVHRVGEADAQSVMQLVLVGLVILPALPDRAFDPFGVLNPFRIWSMVVLIVGISLAAYVAHRFVGADVGTVVAGVLGGLISSTATTVSYARRTRGAPDRVPSTALVLALSSAVQLPRVTLLAGAVGPTFLPQLAPPLLAMAAFIALLAAGTYVMTRRELGRSEIDHAPSDLRAAVGFGLLYAVILLSVAAAKQWLGNKGLYAVAGLSGLADVDAITLSIVQLLKGGSIVPATGWRLILVGVMSNFVFKGIAAIALGDKRLRAWVIAIFGSALLFGAALLLLWPADG